MNISLLSKNRSDRAFLHPSRTITLPGVLQPLANKNFSMFWVGAFLSSTGFWIQNVGQGWQVLQLTNSPFLLGLVTFASTLPNVILTLIGGVVVDRLNRRYLLLATQSVFLCAALLPGILTSLHIINVWEIITIAFIYGIFNALNMPAWNIFIGDLLEDNELKKGIALNSLQFNMSRVVGPAIGGFSIALFGIAGAYYFNALSYIAVIIPLLFLRPKSPVQRGEKKHFWSELKEGFHYTLQNRPLRLILFLQFLIAFCVYPFATLLPVFADSIFHNGAVGLSAFNTAVGIGALLGSTCLIVFNRRVNEGSGMLKLICCLGGVVAILFALTTNLQTALITLVILGASVVISATVANTLTQTMVPEEIRGRVVSILLMTSMGIAPFGNLCAGWVAQIIGAPLTLVIGGALCLIITLLLILVSITFQRKSQLA